jgi:hypothetical protein
LRYQIAGASYFRPALSRENLLPGLYYLLACPPDFEKVFPFVRLVLRSPFNSPVYPLPARYFLEPIAGAFAVWPLTAVVLAAMAGIRRFADRRARAVLGAVCLSAVASVIFIAALGLVSHRFEVDFLPSFALAACCVVGGAAAFTGVKIARLFAMAALLYSVGVNLAMGIEGPYDGFVQAHPEAYVKLARWVSPIESLRPALNPRLTVEASYEFPTEGWSGSVPLIAAGRFGSRYLLSAESIGGNRLRLTSAGALTSPGATSAEVAAIPGAPNRLRLTYQPESRSVTVEWNGDPALRHVLPFLVTAPAQVAVGLDGTGIASTPQRFPWRVSTASKSIDGTEYR